jgi:hypothetical protein
MRFFALFLVVVSVQAVPLWFEPNQGQAHSSVQFLARDVYLGDARLAIHGEAPTPIVMDLIGARKHAHAEGLDLQPGITSYFLGNNPKKWRSGVPHYARVRYKDVYPGIDVVFYGNEAGELEYDFVVAPGADPSAIRLAYNQPVHVDSKGDLLVAGLRQKRPKVFQNGTEIACEYLVGSKNQVRLAVASYDHSQPLTVDPVLVYSTYLGGPAEEWGSGIQVDSSGSAYITGSSRSPASPSLNPFQQVSSFSEDAYVLKLTPSGNAVAFYVVLGGSGDTYSEGMALDGANNAWIAGMTESLDFPTKNAAQPVYGGGFDDGFYAKVSADGRSIVVSSYAGGTSDDWGLGVAAGPDGSGWIIGYTNSFDFPTKNPIKATLTGGLAAFLLNVSPDGKVDFATYFGGSSREFGHAVATDSRGNVYIAGETESDDFPLKNALQPMRNVLPGQSAAFLTKLAPDRSLIYSTFLGGQANCFATFINVDAQGGVYVAGLTSDGFPVLNAAQTTFGGGAEDMFALKVTPDGQKIVYATYLGGSNFELAGGVAIDGMALCISQVIPDRPTSPSRIPCSPTKLRAVVVTPRLLSSRLMAVSCFPVFGVEARTTLRRVSQSTPPATYTLPVSLSQQTFRPRMRFNPPTAAEVATS